MFDIFANASKFEKGLVDGKNVGDFDAKLEFLTNFVLILGSQHPFNFNSYFT